MTAVAERKKAVKKAPAKRPAKRVAAEETAPAKPGDYNFDWSAEYPGEDFLVFTASNGRTVGLAALGPTRKFKPGELRRARKLNEVDQMFTVIERVASAAALAISDDFDDEDYGKMFAAWSEWARTSAGESSSSSAS